MLYFIVKLPKLINYFNLNNYKNYLLADNLTSLHQYEIV